MGTDVNKLNEVIFRTTDGKEFHMNANEFCKIEFHREPHYEDYFERPSYINNEISANFVVKNVTKKRFIKLVMSYGFQKNTAIELAKYCFKKCGYYNVLKFMISDLSLI